MICAYRYDIISEIDIDDDAENDEGQFLFLNFQMLNFLILLINFILFK